MEEINNMKINIDFLDHFSPPKKISSGTLTNLNGEIVPYTIELGLSKSSIYKCNEWRDFTTDFIIAFVDKNPNVFDYRIALQEDIMLEDYNWDWSKKAFFYNTSEYNWFFLKTSDGIQSVCLTFHPRKSVLQNVDIFYIQYVASAPWNRKSSLYKRKYIGVGTEMMKQIQLFFVKTYHFNYGFSLHSLPQAQKFYEKIGMVNLPEYNDVNGLIFYEIDKEHAISFTEGKNDRNR